ncbi:hypothetical protein [Paraburkholderia acidisoli]|uniref:Uncharacterized protein n=1 Tax=Paraburkholderia acidisoli TaxID=2571748 RepID=A0A7Z2GQJ6_9BURK|nr:hypothetical protein [Paraburkholderia acidisoli]QGZ66078.1 hypothetical protein FAZ98_30135 [Paraburkholderia acidisoli]
MFDIPLQHIDGDVFFHYPIGGRTHQIQVTSACLCDIFSSDGSQEGNEISTRENVEEILRVAAHKVYRGTLSPVTVKPTDF